jgi:hypothetical protein
MGADDAEEALDRSARAIPLAERLTDRPAHQPGTLSEVASVTTFRSEKYQSERKVASRSRIRWHSDTRTNQIRSADGTSPRQASYVGSGRHPRTACAAPPPHRVDQVRPQPGGRHDGLDRTNLAGPLDAVHAVELVGNLPELLSMHGRPDRRQFGAQPGRVILVATGGGLRDLRLQAGYPGIGPVRLLTSAANTTAAADESKCRGQRDVDHVRKVRVGPRTHAYVHADSPCTWPNLPGAPGHRSSA